MKASEVRRRINAAAQGRIPFLFGVDYELTGGFFVERPLQQNRVLFRVGEAVNYTAEEPVPYVLKKYPVPYETYASRFGKVMAGLRRGDSFLANLTVPTRVETDLSLLRIFRMSRSPYGLFIPGRMACFSPERFVRIEGRTVSSNPMKGTIDASVPDAESVIGNDYKELSEHHTIVDLIRNDLNRIADRVEVRRFRYIDRVRTGSGEILQVSSEITGVLREHFARNVGDAIFAMLPAGSVSGAPKPSTARLIAAAEDGNRGYYTGVFGYYDGKVLDTAVMIRYVERQTEGLVFRSGGGITVNSDCIAEYREVLDKVYFPIYDEIY